jgi:glycosyltransferase involved in cell wall biosynthesis
VSVVVPAYNAAKRIGRAIQSIAAQEYRPLEIIFVDDASEDDTAVVAMRALESGGLEYKVIRHENNMGVSAARNSGVKAASGEYLIFFDADDEADPDFVSALHGAITTGDCDMAFCGFRDRFEETGKENIISVGADASKKYSVEELFLMRVFKKVKFAIVTTIFKKSFLLENDLEFTEGCSYGEDVEFLTKAFSRCSSVNFSTRCPYIYVHHGDMTSKTSAASREAALRRYSDNAGAICRAARYVAKHSPSPKARDVAENLLLPEGLIKTLNAAAKRNDAAAFYQTLYAPETRRALLGSRKYALQKPEVFLKAASLLLAPRIYFSRRARS